MNRQAKAALSAVLLLVTAGMAPVAAGTAAFPSPASPAVFPASALAEPPAGYEPLRHTVVVETDYTFADLLFDLIGYIWLFNNVFITYDDFPYATGNRFVHTQGVLSMIASDLAGDDDWADRYSRYAVEASVFAYPGEAVGAGARFEGILWKFFGPVAEVYGYDVFPPQSSADAFYDSRTAEGGPLMNVRLGGQLSIVQTNPFSAFVFLEWTRYFNGVTVEGNPNGFVIGAILRSYPCRPVLLEWRGSLHSFGEDSMVAESHLEVGVMVSGPLEVFAAWNYTMNDVLRIEGHGAEVGVRYHF